ncbi:hypothetical protein B296_00032758, partial [Ensete ventricosum]
ADEELGLIRFFFSSSFFSSHKFGFSWFIEDVGRVHNQTSRVRFFFFFSLLLNFLLQKTKRSWMSRLVANKKQEKEKEEKEKPGVEKLEEIADALLGTNPKQRRSRPHK